MSELYFKINKEVNELLSAALDLGEHLLISDGEIARVEDTIRRLCVAYGAESVDVFTITSSIVVTAVFPECGAITQTRRISGVKWNLTAMEALNALSRKACSSKMDVAEIHDELRKIDCDNSLNTVYSRLPDTDGVGLAVYNRLIRAAGFEVIDLEKI